MWITLSRLTVQSIGIDKKPQQKPVSTPEMYCDKNVEIYLNVYESFLE